MKYINIVLDYLLFVILGVLYYVVFALIFQFLGQMS